MTLSNIEHLGRIIARLPETHRVDVEAWGGEPTFRVGRKSYLFAAPDASSISVKLPKDEAEAVIATDQSVSATGYGLGRHGWVSVELGTSPEPARWQEIEEWIRTSYCLIAPRRLTRQVGEKEWSLGDSNS